MGDVSLGLESLNSDVVCYPTMSVDESVFVSVDYEFEARSLVEPTCEESVCEADVAPGLGWTCTETDFDSSVKVVVGLICTCSCVGIRPSEHDWC